MTALARSAADADPPFFTSVPPRDNRDLRALGFVSFHEYRLWCLREGYIDGLGRSQAERRSVRHAVEDDEEIAPHHTEGRRQILNKRVDDKQRWKINTLGWIQDDPELREAFRRLVLHVDRYVDVIKNKRVFEGTSEKGISHGLAAVAYHHKRWIRPVEEWRTPVAKGGHPRKAEQFGSLVRHLFARYEVPEFMDAAWFEGVNERGLRQQEWYMHVAGGGNIRELDTPITLTKRMAHLFANSPHRNAIDKNMRWAQVVGMGGSGHLAAAVLKTRLGRNHQDDEFWSSVVLFLVNNAMVDPTWAGPIVDYIANMKFAPRRIVQEGGGVVEGPPPQPNFTMKGRSAAKLLRQVEAWHGQLGRERDVVFQSWQPCGVRPWEMEEETAELGKVRWTVQELLSSWELAAEGRAMHHCVVSYSDQCADGNTAIWSICAHKEGVEEREGVMTVAVDIKSQTVTQARGRYNAQPNRVPNSAKARAEANTGYFELLSRSAVVLREWMGRERLRWS